jgi:hypothetical protein
VVKAIGVIRLCRDMDGVKSADQQRGYNNEQYRDRSAQPVQRSIGGGEKGVSVVFCW